MYDATWDYVPYTFLVGDNRTIAGVEEAVVGMKVNETKNVTIPPEKAYGLYNKSLIVPMNLSDLIAMNITPSVNVTIPTFYGYARIDSIYPDNDTVFLDFNRAHAGETLSYQITVRKIE
jgi:peptidylprolyl isomerase